MDKMALGHVLLPVLQFSPVSIIPPVLHTQFSPGSEKGLEVFMAKLRQVSSPRYYFEALRKSLMIAVVADEVRIARFRYASGRVSSVLTCR